MIINIHKFLLLENIQQAKNILNKKGLNPNTESDYKKIVNMLNNLPNLIGKFVYFRYIDDIPLDSIEDVIKWIVDNRQISNQLPKNIINYDSFEKLDDDIQKLNREHLIKKFYNSLYRSMKQSIDNLNKDEKLKFNDLAYSFMILPDDIKKNFTPLKYFEENNVGINDFLKSISDYINTNTVNNEKSYILRKINQYKKLLKIKYQKDNVLVIQSNNNEVIKNLGSQSWCIVYNNQHYAEHYFGYAKGNTQFIIFNFNLPSSSSNSLFGVTINENGNPLIGACQDKYNNNVNINDILKWCDIPEGIIVPDETVLNEKKKLQDFLNLLKTEFSIIKIIDYMHKNDIKNINHNFLLRNINRSIILNYRNDFESLIKQHMESDNLNDLFNKYPEIFIFIDDNEYIGTLLYDKSLFNDTKNLIIFFLNLCKNNIKTIFNRTYFGFYVLKYFNLIENINTEKIKEINIKYNINVSDDNIKIINDYIINYKTSFIDRYLYLDNDISIKVEKWENYLNFYNKYELKNDREKSEYDYYNFFDKYISDNHLKHFMIDDSFVNFIIDNVKKNDIDFNFIDVINYGNTTDDYSLLNKNNENYVKIFNELEIKPQNTIEKIFLYKNKGKTLDIDSLKRDLKIKYSEENECDVVEISDFTSLDQFMDGEYFNKLDDMWDFSYKDFSMSDVLYSVNNYINKKNTIEITKYIINKNLSVDILNNLYDKSKTSEFNDDDLKKMKNILSSIISDNEDDLDELIECFIKSISRAETDAYNDKTFNDLFSQIFDDLFFIHFNDNEYFKHQTTNKTILLNDGTTKKITEYSILLRTDLKTMLDFDIDYGDLYYHCDSNFDWEDLAKYLVGESGINVYIDRIYASWTDNIDSFNDELDYFLSDEL